jgi:autotransporter-associated beta strand protein
MNMKKQMTMNKLNATLTAGTTEAPMQPALLKKGSSMNARNRTMKTRNQIKTTMALAAAAMASILPASADPITIPNPGFEARSTFDPFVDGLDRYMQWGKESWRQWQRTANGGPQRIWNPGAPGCELPLGYGGNAPEGDYVMWVTARYADGTNYTVTAGTTNYMEAEVQLLDETFDTTKTYILTAKVARHPTGIWGGYALQLMVDGANVSGATFAGRVDGGTLIAEDLNTMTVTTNGFVTARLRYDPNPANAGLAGLPLQVRLCALEITTNLPTSLATTTYAVFDDVHLEGDVVAAGDTTAPTLPGSSMADDKSGGPIPANTMVTYTVTFSEAMDASTVLAAGFTNAGTAAITLGKITHLSGGQFTVQVTPTAPGTLQLQVPAGAYMTDLSSNALNTASAIVDDTTITVNPGTGNDGTWGVDGAGDWSDPANWVSGVVADGTDKTANFNGTDLTAHRTVFVNTPRKIGNIEFTDPTPNFNLWISGSNPLTLDVSIGAPVINVTQSDRNLIVMSTLAGNKGLTKTGDGRLSLDGTNTYSGTTTVNGGALLFGTHSSLGTGGRSVTAANGTTVAVGYANLDNAFLNRLIENANSFTVALGANSSSNLDFSTSTGANLANASLGAVNLGAVSGGFTTTASTYTGTLTPNGNTYRLGGGGGTLTLSAANALSAGRNVVVSGNVTISGTNSSFNGTATINAGTLTLNNANPMGGVTSFSIASGATVVAGSATALGTPGGISISGGTLSLNASNTIVSAPITLNGGGLITTPLAVDLATLTLNGPIGGTGDLTVQATDGSNKRPIITLGAAGSYNGATTFKTTAAGNLVLQQTVANALPTGTVLTIDNKGGGTGRYVEWNLDGYNQTVAGLMASGDTTGAVIVNSSGTPSTLTVNNSSDDEYAGLLGSGGYAGGAALYYVGDNLTMIKTGIGTLSLSGDNAYTGNTTISGGALAITGVGQLGNGNYAGNILDNATFTYNSSAAQTLSGQVSGTGVLNQAGPGTLTLSGANAYSGATTVNGGTLLVNGSTASGSAVTVNTGGTLGGTGTISNSVTLNGTVSPGASVGTLHSGSQTWNGGAAYQFELSSAVSSAGMDLLILTGTLNVQATAGTPFNLKLVSMADSTTPGPVPDFDGNTSYTWVLGTASGGILNFDASKFAIDTSAFANTYTGTFSVAVQGNNLVVNYTPVMIISSGPLTGTSFPLTFSGRNGQSYQLLTSADVALPLASWTVLDSGTFGASPMTYTDMNATNAQQFYRIQSP